MKHIWILTALLCLAGIARAQDQAEGDEDLYTLSLEELMNISITTASKVEEKTSDAPGIVTTITAREIEQFGALNLVDILDRVVGVQNMSTHIFPQNVTSIRGDLSTGYDTHVLFLINGRPTRESLYGGVNMSILLGLPISIIERIEFVRGPGSVLYGSNAYSGVVNIITKKGTETGGKISALAGSFDGIGTDGHVRINKKDLQILAGFKSFEEKGWEFKVRDAAALANPTGGRTTKTLYGEKNVGANIMVDYKGLKLNSFITKSDQTAFGGANPVWNTGDGDTLANVVTNRSMIDLGYEFKFSDYVSTNINGSYNHSIYSNPFTRVRAFTEDYFAEVTNFIRPLKNLNIILGGTYYYQSGEYGIPGYGSTPLPPTVSPEVVERFRQGPIPFYTNMWYSGYVQADYKPIKSLKLIAGAQYNKTEGINGSLVPRLGAVYNIIDNLGVKLLYGKSFRAPYEYEKSIFLLGSLYGVPDLKPEILSNFDGQLFYNGKSFEISANYFESRKTDNILRVSNPNPSFLTGGGGDIYQNNGKIKSNGVEVEGKYIPNRALYITGSYLYQYNSQTLYDTAHTSNYSLMPNHMIKVGINYAFPFGLSIGVFNTYLTTFHKVASMRDRNPAANGYSNLTAQISLDITKVLRLQTTPSIIFAVYGTNLTDENIYTPDFSSRRLNSIPGRASRAIYGSVTVKF